MKRWVYLVFLLPVLGVFVLSKLPQAAVEQFPVGVYTDTLIASADTYIDSLNATTNFGTAANLNFNSQTATQHTKSLVKFDLSQTTLNNRVIGSNEAIIAAHVLFACAKTTAAPDTSKTIGVFRVLKNWVESEATWNIYKSATNWQTAGAKARVAASNNGLKVDSTFAPTSGDFSFPPASTFTFDDQTYTAGPPLVFTTFRVDVTNLVRHWQDGSWANYGMMVDYLQSNGTGVTQVHSANATNTYLRPRLIITHGVVQMNATQIGNKRTGITNP